MISQIISLSNKSTIKFSKIKKKPAADPVLKS